MVLLDPCLMLERIMVIGTVHGVVSSQEKEMEGNLPLPLNRPKSPLTIYRTNNINRGKRVPKSMAHSWCLSEVSLSEHHYTWLTFTAPLHLAHTQLRNTRLVKTLIDEYKAISVKNKIK